MKGWEAVFIGAAFYAVLLGLTAFIFWVSFNPNDIFSFGRERRWIAGVAGVEIALMLWSAFWSRKAKPQRM